MIRIERLTAHNFKQLREVDLILPASGRVLVEGLNEAGKSTLFEAVHFALYGRGLVTWGGGQGATDSLLAYNTDEGQVELSLRIDDRSLRVGRTLRRGRAGRAHCEVRASDGSSEVVRQTRRVNQEVLVQLGGLDSDALLASCLVEQKKLGKLEELTREKRQEVLLKLLDLDRLIRVKRHFTWKRDDDRNLAVAEQRLRLAEAARCLSELSTQLADVEQRISVVQVAQTLADIGASSDRAASLGQSLIEVEQCLATVHRELDRIQDLDRVILLAQSAVDCDRQAEISRQQVDEYEGELVQLERVASETVPRLEAERTSLSQIGLCLERLAALDNQAAELQKKQARLAAGPLECDDPDLDEPSRDAADRVRRAGLIEAYRSWAQATRDAATRRGGQKQIATLERAAASAEDEDHKAAENVRRSWIPLGIALFVTLLGAVGGLFASPRLGLLVLAGVVALLWSWRRRSAAIRAHQRTSAIAKSKRGLAHDERIRLETLLGKAAPDLSRPAALIRDLGGDEPASPEHAEELADHLEGEFPADWSLATLRDEARVVQGQFLAKRLRILGEEHHSLEVELDRHGGALPGLGDDRDSEMTAESPVDPLPSPQPNGSTGTESSYTLLLLHDIAAARRTVDQRKGRVDEKLQQAREQLAGRPELRRSQSVARAEYLQLATRRDRLWSEALRQVSSQSDPSFVRDVVESRLADLKHERSRLDLAAAQAENERLLGEQGSQTALLKQTHAALEAQRENARALIWTLGLEPPADLDPEALLSLIPGLPSVPNETQGELNRLESVRFRLAADRQAEENEATRLEAGLHLNRSDLDESACRAEAEQLRHRKQVCERAADILDRVRANVLDAVLPNTLSYMRLFLPLLTAGRYHDAQLDSESYGIEVWDSQLQNFVEKDVFSGATQDQFSLALRLGFALAALPQERGVRPGFLFLDEPVAGFDGQRRDALLNLLDSSDLAEYFPQVFFAVPSGVFDRNPLTYLVRLDNGRVIESTLPTGDCSGLR